MKPEDFKGLAMLTQIGLIFVVCIGIGFFLGRFLDGWLGTTPWLMLVGLLIGIGAAFKSLFDLLPK